MIFITFTVNVNCIIIEQFVCPLTLPELFRLEEFNKTTSMKFGIDNDDQAIWMKM